MRTKYDPLKNDKLEERAKEMAEYYMARRQRMGCGGFEACLRRVAQENPPLYELLKQELREYEAIERRERQNKNPK